MKKNIVFLGIGEESCGDSIAIRLWDGENEGTQRVIVIDGGYKDDWQKVQKLVQDNFGAAWIDLVISTHPDKDHIGGLPGVVENLDVKALWMHQPWNHSDEYLAYRQEEFVTLNATSKLKNSLQSSNDLALAAEAKGIIIEEPFAGKQFFTPFGTLTILSPTLEFYENLLPQILDKSAAAKNASLQTSSSGTLPTLDALFRQLSGAVANKLEDHNIETLTNSGTTSPSNNTSTVILLELSSGEKMLFTGDAGLEALELAHSNYIALGHLPGQLNFVQVPHHGSRQNVGPDILDKFLGQKTNSSDIKRGTAYVSAAANCKKDGHPKKSVSNAFRRRGYPVHQTAGEHLKHGHELKGFTKTVEPLPHFNEVEDN
jgi:beta-lactamase superfamily II metal-dependent hydrolase